MGLINFLAHNGHIVVSKHLIHQIGLEETILLGELCAEYNYYCNINKLEDGFFPSSVENIERQTTFKRRMQQTLFNSLAEKKLIEVKKDGYPAKRLIRIDENAILEIVLQSAPNAPTDDTVSTNGADINKNSMYLHIVSNNNKHTTNIGNYSYSMSAPTVSTEEEKNPPKKKNKKQKVVKPKEQKYIIGEFENVILTLPEINKLSELYGGDNNLDIAIDILGNYIKASGHKYKSHYAVLRKNNWVYNRFQQLYGKGKKNGL